MLKVFNDPISIISWFSFLCLVLSPLFPSLWLPAQIVLHLSLIDLTCPPFCCNQFPCSVFSLSDSLLFTLMCLLCFVVPLLDFEFRLVFSSVGFLDSPGSFLHTFVGQNRNFLVPDFLSGASPLDCQFSFIVSDLHNCQTVVDCSRFSSWSKPKPYVVHIQPDVLWHKKLCPNMKHSHTAVNPESGSTLNSQ